MPLMGTCGDPTVNAFINGLEARLEALEKTVAKLGKANDGMSAGEIKKIATEAATEAATAAAAKVVAESKPVSGESAGTGFRR